MGKCFSMCKNNEGATAVSYSYQRRQSSYQSDDSNENEGIVEAMILPAESCREDDIETSITSSRSDERNNRTDGAISYQRDSSHNDDRTDGAISYQQDSSHNDNRTDGAISYQQDSSHNEDRTDGAISYQQDSSHNDDRTDGTISYQQDSSHNDDRTDGTISYQQDSSHIEDRTDGAISYQQDSSHNEDRTDGAISYQQDSSHNDDRTDGAISYQQDSSHIEDRTDGAISYQQDSSHNEDRTDGAISYQQDSSHNDDRTDGTISYQQDSSHNDDRTDEANYSQPENSGKSLCEDKVLSAKFLSDLSGEIGIEWQLLFFSIGLTTVEVEHIDMDYPNQSRKKNFEALLLWRRKNKQHQAAVQLQLLIDGFKEISRSDLAHKYAGYLNEPNLSLISAKESCDEEPDVNRLKERLVEMNDLEIPLTPLQEDSDKLPIEQLFASVIIKEDSKETRKGKKSAQDGKEQERKEVKTPEDMLTKNGKPVRRVYMLGDAAHGKTTYCARLLKKWCNAQKPGMTYRPLNEWENALSQFDFVFHLKFRHVDPSRSNVIDMICQDILGEDTGLHTAAKHVLSSDKYRCLIIMDGLDEWKPDQSVIAQLKHKGMPNIDNMSNCVIFTTMRPWMFAAVAGLVRDDDRVIEIQGLDDKGIEDVIEQVLVHYYEMKPDSDEYTAKYNEIISKLIDRTLKSFIHIPLLAVVCIQIWCTGKQVGNSLTSFYSVMIDMLIERAKVNIKTLEDKQIMQNLPEILIENENITNYFSILLKLGKVAYEGLLSNKENLEFQKRKLEKELGREELQFALDVGLISQTEAPSITTRKVNVHFFHKSVQEFLAVIYIVTQKKVSDNFCTRLCNVKVIMELSNVIMFICGMCPSLGSVISQRVVSVADSDGEICEYRELPWGGNDTTVRELYKLQVSWYREFKYGQTDSPVTDSPVTFHVSDVFLASYSDTETVRVTRELLSGHHDIRSLLLWLVPTDGDRGITDTELEDFLSNTDKTRSLVTLYIYGGVRSVHTLCIPSLRTLCLEHVTIQDRDSVHPVLTHTNRLQRIRQWFRTLYCRHTDSVHRPLISNMDRLQRLELYKVSLGDRGLGLTPHMTDLQVIELTDVSLGDRGLGLTPHMTDLQKVELHIVRMTQSGWGRLIQSVIDIHHQFVVILEDIDIDRDSVSTLHSSPHISVTQDYSWYIEFTRVWPLT